MEKRDKFIEESIVPKSHPAHYLMHKYWGRKPHNVINEYISNFTQEEDLVLDPFMGGGGVIIESKKLNRKSIGVDLNPLSVFITENTLSSINFEELEKCFERIIRSLPSEVIDITYTQCPECSKLCLIDNAVWKEGHLARIKANCELHGVFRKDPNDFDLRQLKKASELLIKNESEGLFYPKEKMLDYVKRSGKTHINQLFSERNLLICSLIFKEISNIDNKEIRNCLKMVFNSMLPNVSRMIPANEENITGKSGWQISKFWVPKIHTEKNVIESFNLRFNKIVKGKKEILELIKDIDHKLFNKTAENMDFIENESVDYIFTDPPYGESISYFGLSMFWNAWLSENVSYDDEIIYDPYRKKGHEDYKSRLTNAYKEMYRVMKPGKYLSFTFHNRSLKFWKTIIDACLDAGFEITQVVWQSQAVSSGTQGINRKNTLKGDFIYTFIKPLKSLKNNNKEDVQGEEILIKEINKLLKNSSFVETPKLYEHIIPIIINERAFLDSNDKILDVELFLSNNYKSAELNENGTKKYGWSKK